MFQLSGYDCGYCYHSSCLSTPKAPGASGEALDTVKKRHMHEADFVLSLSC